MIEIIKDGKIYYVRQDKTYLEEYPNGDYIKDKTIPGLLYKVIQNPNHTFPEYIDAYGPKKEVILSLNSLKELYTLEETHPELFI